jgi:hypothetical protein
MRSDVQVVYHVTIVTLNFISSETARVAYDKISAALKEYKLFKNDRAETVELELEDGAATLKLERMDAVMFNDGAQKEEQLRVALEEEKIARKMRESLDLPALR